MAVRFGCRKRRNGLEKIKGVLPSMVPTCNDGVDWKSGWTENSVETKNIKQVICLGFSAVTAGSVTAVS
jgi:hypothetical protein